MTNANKPVTPVAPRQPASAKQPVVTPSPFVHTPSMVSRVSLEAIDDYQKTRSQNVIYGIPRLDELVPPARPGNLVVVLANTSNLKTTFMQWMAIQNARAIRADENECIVYVSLEDTVPELGINDLARATGINIVDVLANRDLSDDEWHRIREAGTDRATMPIFVVGYTPVVMNGKRQVLPALTMEEVRKALFYIENSIGLHPRAVFLDYIQRIPGMPGEDRNEIDRNTHNMERAKQLAMMIAAPVIVGCQAKRECVDRPNPLPGVTDAHMTSAVEHLANVILSVLYAIRACRPDHGHEFGYYEVPVLAKDGRTYVSQEVPADEHLAVFGVPKSKRGRAMLTVAAHVDVITGQWEDYHDPNGNKVGVGEVQMVESSGASADFDASMDVDGIADATPLHPAPPPSLSWDEWNAAITPPEDDD